MFGADLCIATLELSSAINRHFRALLCASYSHGALMSISEHVLHKITLVKNILQEGGAKGELQRPGIGSCGDEGEVVY